MMGEDVVERCTWNGSDVWDRSRSDGSVSPAVAAAYREYGCLILRSFFAHGGLGPIRVDLESLVRLQMAEVDGLEANAAERSVSDLFERGILDLARGARWRVGAIYDASMKLLSTRALALDRQAVLR